MDDLARRHALPDAANRSAQALPTLHHLNLRSATARSDGWTKITDVTAIVAELHLLAERLPQAIGQLDTALRTRAEVVGRHPLRHRSRPLFDVVDAVLDMPTRDGASLEQHLLADLRSGDRRSFVNRHAVRG